MTLPTDYNARKAIPLYDFLTGYFPDALVEVTKVAVEGNKQHNPGEPLHWARGKSMDQLNTAMRHMFDHRVSKRDTDGCLHLAKAAWRLLAEIQLLTEAEAKVGAARLMTDAELKEHDITVEVAESQASFGDAIEALSEPAVLPTYMTGLSRHFCAGTNVTELGWAAECEKCKTALYGPREI